MIGQTKKTPEAALKTAGACLQARFTPEATDFKASGLLRVLLRHPCHSAGRLENKGYFTWTALSKKRMASKIPFTMHMSPGILRHL